MAAGRSYSSELSLMVWQLGLWDQQLDFESRRQLRLVCRALRAAVDPLIDTLALPLHAYGSPATAHRVAAFHRRCTAAQTLRVHLPGVERYVTSGTADYAQAYAEAAVPLLAVQQCRVSGACRYCSGSHVAVLQSLLGALPQLQGVSIMLAGGYWSNLKGLSPRSAAQLLPVLSVCAQLHSLALDYDPAKDWPAGSEAVGGMQAALPQLTQLRALSLTGSASVDQLHCLTCLTRLERLGVRSLCTVDYLNLGDAVEQLPSVHTLSAPWTDPLPPPPQPPRPAGSSSTSLFAPAGSAELDHAVLGALPNLTRVERMRIRLNLHSRGMLPTVQLPALVQRLEGCADEWRLDVYLTDVLPGLQEQLPPGSLAALRHLWVGAPNGTLPAPQPQQWTTALGMMLAAAPNICSLALSHLPDEATLLQPLAHASQLQTLLLDMPPHVADGAPRLVALVRSLAAHRAALRCVRVSGWCAGVVGDAAALLEATGCSIRLRCGTRGD